MTDYLLKFPSKSIAEQFGIANGFVEEIDGTLTSFLSSHTHALHEIGEHNGTDFWVLFRDLVGIPIPAGGEQFIFWCSEWTVEDEVGDQIPVPKPEFNPNVPSVFWLDDIVLKTQFRPIIVS